MKILLPPGIGDIYWVMCIMEDFLQRHGMSKFHAGITSISLGKRNRSYDYVNMLHLVEDVSYHEWNVHASSAWRKCVHNGEGFIVPNVEGFDFFMCLNGHLESGKTLEETGYKVDYYPRISHKHEDIKWCEDFRRKVGPYVVGFVTDHGFYQKWLQELPLQSIFQLFGMIYRKTGCKIVLTGAKWDNNLANQYLVKLGEDNGIVVNMINKTTLGQFFGLLLAADGCLGFCGGNTIMSTVFRKPTVIIWNNFFKQMFWRVTCPPDSFGKWYLPAGSYEKPEDIANKLFECMRYNGFPF